MPTYVNVHKHSLYDVEKITSRRWYSAVLHKVAACLRCLFSLSDV